MGSTWISLDSLSAARFLPTRNTRRCWHHRRRIHLQSNQTTIPQKQARRRRDEERNALSQLQTQENWFREIRLLFAQLSLRARRFVSLVPGRGKDRYGPDDVRIKDDDHSKPKELQLRSAIRQYAAKPSERARGRDRRAQPGLHRRRSERLHRPASLSLPVDSQGQNISECQHQTAPFPKIVRVKR